MKTAWKVLGPDRTAYHGGNGAWPEPGEWLRAKGALVPCQNGLHLCAREHLVRWLGPCIWGVEYDESECIDHGDKLVVRAARLIAPVEAWNDRTARLFAADCAERVVEIYEAQYPGDARPRQAIEAARAFARGEIDDAACAAASAAASAAARAAARDAARDAELAWQTDRLFDYLEGRAS